MGLIYSNARLLLEARRNGYSFERIATLGRQQIDITAKHYTTLADQFERFATELRQASLPSAEFADEFFRIGLGSIEIESIDLSDYQGATLLHDLNLPIGDQLRRRFDAVIDGGTLEHIFNFPVALKNCMEMVRVGGCIMLATTANNHCGHGFYQFSPELFFRAFQPRHGFEIERVILIKHPFPGIELSQTQECFEVVDPDVLRSRVGLVCDSPVMIQVLAKRVNDAASLDEFPQQSDYEHLWKTADAPSPDNNPSVDSKSIAEIPFSQLSGLRKIKRLGGNVCRGLEKKLPVTWRKWINGRRQLRTYSLRNRKHFRPW